MKKKKILIVEDDRSSAEYASMLLDANGYEAHVARDGQEAVAKAKKILPNLILLDIMMPGLSGIDTCKILRQDPALQKIPVIMVTSMTQMSDIEKAFAVGANDYIVKPYNTERLIQKIKKHLGE